MMVRLARVVENTKDQNPAVSVERSEPQDLVAPPPAFAIDIS